MTDTVTVVGAAQVQVNLAGLSDKFRSRIARAITASTIDVQGEIKSSALAGGVLNVRSGRLRRGVNVQTEETPGAIVGTVGDNVSYGRFWELGFKGVEKVRAHWRKVRSGSGRRVKYMTQVKAHYRKVNQDPRSFLLSTLRQMSPKIKDRIARAMGEPL